MVRRPPRAHQGPAGIGRVECLTIGQRRAAECRLRCRVHTDREEGEHLLVRSGLGLEGQAPLRKRGADDDAGEGADRGDRIGTQAIVVEGADPEVRLAIEVLRGPRHGPGGGIGGEHRPGHEGHAKGDTKDGQDGSRRSSGQAPPGNGR